MQSAVQGGGPPTQDVLVYNYPVEGNADLIRQVLGVYGMVENVIIVTGHIFLRSVTV